MRGVSGTQQGSRVQTRVQGRAKQEEVALALDLYRGSRIPYGRKEGGEAGAKLGWALNAGRSAAR